MPFIDSFEERIGERKKEMKGESAIFLREKEREKEEEEKGKSKENVFLPGNEKVKNEERRE